MRLLTVLIIWACAFNFSNAQESPYENILKKDQPPMSIGHDDDKIRSLLKQGYNATISEVRSDYHYWRQGFSDLDSLLDSLERFQIYRVELEGEMDKLKFATQKLAFAKEIEDYCANGKSTPRSGYLREMDQQRATSYRIFVEIELERLKEGDFHPKDQ